MATMNDTKQPVQKIQQGAVQKAQEQTAPPRERRLRAYLFQFVLVMGIVGFAVLTFLVKTIQSFPIDLRITLGIQSINLPLFGGLMWAISWIGFFPQSIIITMLVIIAILFFGLQWEAVTAIIASILTITVNLIVKDLVARPRPLPTAVHVFSKLTDYSFPSGHVMYYVGFFGFVGFLAFTLLKHSWPRVVLLTVVSVLVGLVGISRIYEGEHWASDVLGAYILGALCLWGIIQIYRWGKTRFFVRQPVAKPSQVEKA